MSAALAVCLFVAAVVFIYDAKRALWPVIPGEQGWRRARVAATTTAFIASFALLRTAGPLWIKRAAVLALLLSLAVVLRCSIPLKRLVARKLLYRREERQEGT
jgi:hypothetical protein